MLLSRYPNNYVAWLVVGAVTAGAGLLSLGLSWFQSVDFGVGFFQGLGVALLIGSSFLNVRGLLLYRGRKLQ
jgi:hypothetical protein